MATPSLDFVGPNAIVDNDRVSYWERQRVLNEEMIKYLEEHHGFNKFE